MTNKSSPLRGNIAAVADLFAGPGGLSLGFRNAGFDIVAAVECDPCASTTYENNFPETRLFKDKIENVEISKLLDALPKKPYQKIVLIGGPPCQPFSTANRQTNGSDNPQVSAVDYFVSFVETIMPDAFLFENVVSFSYMNKGESLKLLEERLKKLGFKIDTAIIDFDKFGVPQARRRLFVGGLGKCNLRSFRFSPEPNKGPKPTVKDAISDLPPLEDGGGGKNEMDYPKRKKLLPYQVKARTDSNKLYNHWASKNCEDVVRTIKCIRKGSSLTKSWSILPECVKRRYNNAEAIHSNIYRRLRWSEQSPTIVHARRAMLLHPRVNRIISVREAARIQSFPDSFRFYGCIHSQYQQVANAVSPVLAEALAKVLLRHLDRKQAIHSRKYLKAFQLDRSTNCGLLSDRVE